MKAQSFSFMKKMVPKILAKEKFLTNRSATEFRGKLDAGGIMHLYTGMRTKNCMKIGDAKVIQRVKWYFVNVPLYNVHADNRKSPIEKYSWSQFAKIDGFEKWYEFVDYFLFHKNRDLGFYCYLFKLIED